MQIFNNFIKYCNSNSILFNMSFRPGEHLPYSVYFKTDYQKDIRAEGVDLNGICSELFLELLKDALRLEKMHINELGTATKCINDLANLGISVQEDS